MLILLLLAVIWLSVAAVHYALRGRQPWQLLQGERRRVQLIRGLESVRHGIALLYWVISIVVIAQLVLYLAVQDMRFVLAWVLAIGAVAEWLVRTSMVQTQVLLVMYRVAISYGHHLRFVARLLRALEKIAKRVLSESPVFRDKNELSQLVRHHQQVHRILDKTQQRQIETLLGVDTRSIQAKVIPLRSAQMVKAEDVMGPMVLTELHDSPYMSFPVYSKRKAKIVGILDQGVAVSHASHNAKVSSIMEERIVYLPHDATIAQALQTFIETSSAISVIIDDDTQPVGVLYIQDILRDLFEKPEGNK